MYPSYELSYLCQKQKVPIFCLHIVHKWFPVLIALTYWSLGVRHKFKVNLRTYAWGVEGVEPCLLAFTHMKEFKKKMFLILFIIHSSRTIQWADSHIYNIQPGISVLHACMSTGKLMSVSLHHPGRRVGGFCPSREVSFVGDSRHHTPLLWRAEGVHVFFVQILFIPLQRGGLPHQALDLPVPRDARRHLIVGGIRLGTHNVPL